MAKLTDRACATTKPKPAGSVLLGDGNCLWLVINPGGSRSWLIDYLINGQRRKLIIGNYDSNGGNLKILTRFWMVADYRWRKLEP